MTVPHPFALPPLLLLLAIASTPAAAALQARLDRDHIEPGESVELTLQRDGRSDSQPDLAPLEKDFAILGRASGTNIQIVNGQMSAQAQLRLSLAPKHSGRLQIPALNWDGERSPSLTLDVATSRAGNGAGSNAASAASAHVFMTHTLEQKQPYVQAGTTLKVRIHTDQPLYQAGLDLPASNDVSIQQIGKDRHSEETLGDRHYQVIERDYLLFPQHSGRISLAGPVLQAQITDAQAGDPFAGDPFGKAFGNFFGRNPFAGMVNATRPMRLQGDAIVLDVRPRPAAAVGQTWLPARQIKLEESWRPGNGEIHAGEPITRQLRLTALGLSAAQLPDIAATMPLPDGIKAYPDQAKLSTEASGDNISASREQEVALIASRPGRYVLPALQLTWWDTARDKPQVAILPERTLQILPALGADPTGSAPPSANAFTGLTRAAPSSPASASVTPLSIATPGSREFPWPWLSLILGLLWLATLAAWWRTRQPAPIRVPNLQTVGLNSSQAGVARKAFSQACRNNDAPEARRQLLAWARAAWPEAPPLGLNGLARRLDKPELHGLLRDLDRACYASGDWQGTALIEVIPGSPVETKAQADKGAELAGLYP